MKEEEEEEEEEEEFFSLPVFITVMICSSSFSI